MVDSLGDLPGIILVWNFYFHYDVTFLRFPHFWDQMGLRFWCIHFSFNSNFLPFFIFGVTVKFLLLISQNDMIGFFLGSLVGVLLGISLQ